MSSNSLGDGVSEDVDHDIHVVASGLGVRASLVRRVRERFRIGSRKAGQAHGQACAQEVLITQRIQIDFGIDGEIRRQRSIELARREAHRAFETG
jgi:hypothetical protein